MARMDSFCPRCGRIVPAGERCGCRPRPKRKPTQGDLLRMEREPWRKAYSTREYQDARQVAIARTRGCCTDCGKTCAWFDGHKWHTQGMDGEVDHVRALVEGGSNDPNNLELRCKSCHGKRDAARRKGNTR